MFSEEEVARIKKFLADKQFLEKHTYSRSDGEGRKASLVMWNQPGSDLTGLVARTNRMVDTVEQVHKDRLGVADHAGY